MILPAWINVNANGIPTLSSRDINVTTTEVQYDFANHRNVGAPFRGLIVVRLAQEIPTGTTATLPIVFTTSRGNSQNVTTLGGVNVTVADITGTGVYLLWYESQTGTLQLLTGSLT